MTVEELRSTYLTYKEDMDKWFLTHGLTTLKDYDEYRAPEVWGENYKKDQRYFEEISNNKNMVYGVISLTQQLKELGDRVVKTKADAFLETLNVDMRRLDNLLFTARERLKFYENIMRVMGNISWGSY